MYPARSNSYENAESVNSLLLTPHELNSRSRLDDELIRNVEVRHTENGRCIDFPESTLNDRAETEKPTGAILVVKSDGRC